MNHPKFELLFVTFDTVGKPIVQARDAVKNLCNLYTVRGFANGITFRMTHELEYNTSMKNNSQNLQQSIKPPKLIKRKLVEGIPGNTLISKEQYRALSLSSIDLSNQIAEHVSFEEALFSQVKMMNTQLEEMRLEDARLNECDLMAANWFKAGWYRTELIGCRMTGFLAAEAHFQDVLFKDCQINLVQLRFATFKSVRFEHCDLSEIELFEADLSHVGLIDCNLRNAELSGSRLTGVDLSTCNLEGAHVGIKELRGATINLHQAISLVQAAGIEVDLQPE